MAFASSQPHSNNTENNRREDSILKSHVVSDNEDSSGNHDAARVEFPFKLHQLLEDAEHNHIDHDIISWLPCGRAFKIHNKIKFEIKIMPRYFKASSYKSFHRNLNLWGFETNRKGVYKGAKSNPLFARGHPDRCHHMRRIKNKNSQFSEKSGRSTLARDIVAPPASMFASHHSSIASNSMTSSMPRCGSSAPQEAPEAAAAINREIVCKLLILNMLNTDLAQRRTVQVQQVGTFLPWRSDISSSLSFTSALLRHHQRTGQISNHSLADALDLMRDLGDSSPSYE